MKYISSGPLLLTRFESRESLHPELGHLSLTRLLSEMAIRDGSERRWDTPLPEAQQLAYSDLGQLWENALEVEFKRRQGERAKSEDSRLILQHKLCAEGIHMIPDSHVPDVLGQEYKLSFRPPPSTPEKLLEQKPSWKAQTMCYAHNLGVYDWQFFVCWCGKKPEPVKYQYKYTKAECKKMWDEVLKFRDLTIKRSSTEV